MSEANSEETPSEEQKPAPLTKIDLTDYQLSRVRRIGALGPEASQAKQMIDQLAQVFGEAEVEAESVSAVSLGERTILMIEIGSGDTDEIVSFLGGILAKELSGPVVGLIGNRAFTHRLNVALDAAGHGTNLLLPDEIIWVIPASLESTFKDLDDAFDSSDEDDSAT